MLNEEYLQVWKAYMGRTQHAGAAAVLTLLHVLDQGPHRTYTVACGETGEPVEAPKAEAPVVAAIEPAEPAPVVEADKSAETVFDGDDKPALSVEADEWAGLLKAYKVLKGGNAATS